MRIANNQLTAEDEGVIFYGNNKGRRSAARERICHAGL